MRSGSTRRHLDPLSLAAALLPVIAIAFDAWGIFYYRQGLRNAPLDFSSSAVAAAGVLSLAVAVLGMRLWGLTKRNDPRATLSWLLLPLVLILWPATCAVRPRPIEMYRRGLAEWARRELDVAAIRAWQAGRTPVTSPQKIPHGALPPALFELDPAVIEQHPRGLLLQWGRFSTMPGRQRKMFVAADDSAQPPDEGLAFWRMVSDGLFVGAHGGP